MEKKPVKYIQTENPKSSKKLKEMKLLTNYIPIKKANGQSNISEYETESSIQKNFSNKCQKNKNHLQAKSVQATHNNQISPKKNINKNMKEKVHQRHNRSSRGSLYNLNNLNLGDYFSEKIIMTRQKFIDYKDNKINTLKNELSLLKKELILYEKKNNNININNNNINDKTNNIQRNKSHSMDKNLNANKNKLETQPVCGNNDKVMLENNSYASFNIFHSNEILCNNGDADKKLKKHLSNLLYENNTPNININIQTNKSNNINNAFRYKNKNKKTKKNLNKDMNKKKLMNVIYLSKKGCYDYTNNNYDHKAKVMNINNNDNFKNKNEEKEIKHELHFYANTMKEREILLKESIKNKKEKNNDNVIKYELQNLNDRMNNIFNSFFDYYEKNNNKCNSN